MLNHNHHYLIGIDTGCNTGICAYSRKEKKILYLDTVMIHKAMEYVASFHKAYPGQVFVRVEDARLRKWIPKQKNEKAERGRREGAGSVKRDAVIWEDFLTDLKINFEMVAPKNNNTKVDAAYFKKLTRWEGKTNSHNRDSALLVFGF
jgi:hypothetical protein